MTNHHKTNTDLSQKAKKWHCVRQTYNTHDTTMLWWNITFMSIH